MKRVIFAILVIAAFSTSAIAKYSGGSGEPNDPYQIADVNDLLTLANDANDYNKCFILTADIDLDPNLPSGQVFTTAVIAIDINNSTIHFQGTSFTGTFDGNGYKISNLTINGGGNHFLGLFGSAGGEVKNLKIENVSINGGYNSQYISALAGLNDYGTISNCSSTGTLATGNISYDLGGLVGRNRGSIYNCYSTCIVNCEDYTYYIGGLVGINYGTISDCFSSGDISGGYESYHFGGLVGENWSNGNISNCFSTGNITCGDDSSHVGGMVGFSESVISNSYSTGAVSGGNAIYAFGGLVGGNGDILTNCYSTGDVNGGTSYRLGGLVGQLYNSGYIIKCYSIGNVNGINTVGLGGLVGAKALGTISSSYFLITSGPDNDCGTPLTDTQMKQQASFVGWDFNDVWHICESANYPKLLWQILLTDFVCPDGVNLNDYAFFAQRWLDTNCASNNNCEGTDLDLSGMVDWYDLYAFVENWLEGI